MSKRTIILECGADRVAVGVFSGSPRRLCLHAFDSEALDCVEDEGDVAKWLAATGAALRPLAARTGIRGGVLVVTPAHLTLTKAIRIPRVGPAQREKILRFEAAQHIPYAPADVAWDSVVIGETAGECEVLLAAAKRAVLDPLCALLLEAGFEPRTILPAPFATLAGFRLLRPDTEGKNPVLCLNFGSRSTTLLLFESSRFAMRILALGTGDVAPLETTRAKLPQEIARSLLHFQWRNDMGKPGKILLAGNGAGTTELAEAIRGKFNLPMEVADLRRFPEFSDAPAGGIVQAGKSDLLDLVGAAATQFQPGHFPIDLLPTGIRESIGSRKRRPWLIAAAILMMGALLPPLFHFRQLADEARKKTAAIERELVPWRQRDVRNRENLRQIGELNDRLKNVLQIGEKRTSWLALLSGLQEQFERIGDVWLDGMEEVPAGEGGARKLLVSGRMLDRLHPLATTGPEISFRVKTLLAGLAECPLVTAVENERFDSRQPGVLKFDFVLVTDPMRPL